VTTVIVPTFNSEASVAGTLQSIREQSRQPENILVIDGGSRDGTLTVAARFLRPCDQIVSEPDHGPYDAMNKGIRLARSKVVAILNSDDRWLPGTLELVEQTFTDSAEIGIVHGDIHYVMDQSNTLRIRPTIGFWRSLGLGLPTVHSATFIRKDVYLQHGLYNFERFPMTADQEFVYRVLARAVKDRYVAEVLTVMVGGGLSASADLTTEFDSLLDVLQPRKRWLAKRIRRLLNHDNRFYNGMVSSGFARAIFSRLLVPAQFKRAAGGWVRRLKARNCS
jgi:glycosyltransferase involved in cell wall biosynthesis